MSSDSSDSETEEENTVCFPTVLRMVNQDRKKMGLGSLSKKTLILELSKKKSSKLPKRKQYYLSSSMHRPTKRVKKNMTMKQYSRSLTHKKKTAKEKPIVFKKSPRLTTKYEQFFDRLIGNIKQKKELLNLFKPSNKSVHRVLVGPPGTGKSYMLERIKKQYQTVITGEHIEIVKNSNENIPQTSNVCVMIDNLESMTKAASLYLKRQLIRYDHRKKMIPPKFHFIVCTTNLFEAGKQFGFLNSFKKVKFYRISNNDLQWYIQRVASFHPQIVRRLLCNANGDIRQLKYGIQLARQKERMIQSKVFRPKNRTECLSTIQDQRDIHHSPFDEVKMIMQNRHKVHQRFVSEKAVDLGHHNMYEILSNKNEELTLENCCKVLDNLSFGDVQVDQDSGMHKSVRNHAFSEVFCKSIRLDYEQMFERSQEMRQKKNIMGDTKFFFTSLNGQRVPNDMEYIQQSLKCIKSIPRDKLDAAMKISNIQPSLLNDAKEMFEELEVEEQLQNNIVVKPMFE